MKERGCLCTPPKGGPAQECKGSKRHPRLILCGDAFLCSEKSISLQKALYVTRGLGDARMEDDTKALRLE